MAKQPERRTAVGPRRGPRLDSGGDLVLNHCRRRSEGRPLRLIFYCDHHLDRRGALRHDFGRHRSNGTCLGAAGGRTRRGLPICRHRAGRRTPDRPRLPRSWRADALRSSHRDGRVRERSCHPHLPRPGSSHPLERRHR